MALITLQEALEHLRVDEDEATDAGFLQDLTIKMEAVSSLVLRYCNLAANSYLNSAGEPTDVPYYIKAACLIWLGILFKHRDGGSDETLVWGQIPVAVSSILVQYRVPPMA